MDLKREYRHSPWTWLIPTLLDWCEYNWKMLDCSCLVFFSFVQPLYDFCASSTKRKSMKALQLGRMRGLSHCAWCTARAVSTKVLYHNDREIYSHHKRFMDDRIEKWATQNDTMGVAKNRETRYHLHDHIVGHYTWKYKCYKNQTTRRNARYCAGVPHCRCGGFARSLWMLQARSAWA